MFGKNGYSGYSMSNRAVEAYEDGERPISKWNKDDLLDEIEDYACEIKKTIDMDALRKVSYKKLKDFFLLNSSWHHTSKFYNETQFYSIDEYSIEQFNDEDLKELLTKPKRVRHEKVILEEKKAKCNFSERNGHSRHAKWTDYEEIGIVRGNWFYRPQGGKKYIYGNYINKIEYLDD